MAANWRQASGKDKSIHQINERRVNAGNGQETILDRFYFFELRRWGESGEAEGQVTGGLPWKPRASSEVESVKQGH